MGEIGVEVFPFSFWYTETKIHWLKSQDPKDKLSSKVFICITSRGGDTYDEGKEQVLQLQTKEL